MIHPTALIDSAAKLAPDVVVGPYVVIEGPVMVAAGTRIQAHAVLTGSVSIGEDCTIGYGAVVGGTPQDLSFKPDTDSSVMIGKRNVIREYCTIHRGTKPGTATVVGEDNYLMAGVHLAHNVRLGNSIIIANNSLLGGYVEVQDRVFIGGGSVFHQFIRVGTLAVTQGQSGFSKDVPPFTMAAEHNLVAGLNVVGLRRAGLNPSQRAEIKDAFNLLYRSGLNVSQALQRATERTWGEHATTFFDFARAATKRGLCALKETSRGLPDAAGE